MQALRPEFHLRADRFYNAPDTEMDFTEQGGLMWGDSAVGKLVAGPDALRPVSRGHLMRERSRYSLGCSASSMLRMGMPITLSPFW